MESRLNNTQIALLQIIAGDMIPSSERFKVPGADDESIFHAILLAAEREYARLIDALNLLESSAQSKHGKAFSSLDPSKRISIFEALSLEFWGVVNVIGELILQCYYRDDRVLHSLNMESRAPFPDGHEVEESDWSLLNPVRNRGKIYR